MQTVHPNQRPHRIRALTIVLIAIGVGTVTACSEDAPPEPDVAAESGATGEEEAVDESPTPDDAPSETGDGGVPSCAEPAAPRVLAGRDGSDIVVAGLDGEEMWRIDNGQPSPAPDYWDVVYASLPTNIVVVSNGETVSLRHTDDGQVIVSAPGDSFDVGADCSVVAAGDGTVTAFGPDGATRWTRVGSGVRIAGAQDEVVLVSSEEDDGAVVDAMTGATLWQIPVFSELHVARSVIIVESADNYRTYFDALTGEFLWEASGGDTRVIDRIDVEIFPAEGSFSVVDIRTGNELVSRTGRMLDTTPRGSIVYQDASGNYGFIADPTTGTDSWTMAAQDVVGACDDLTLVEGAGVPTGSPTPTEATMRTLTAVGPDGQHLWDVTGVAGIVTFAGEMIVMTDHEARTTALVRREDGELVGEFDFPLDLYPLSQCGGSWYEFSIWGYGEPSRPVIGWLTGSGMDMYDEATGERLWSVE